MNELDIRKIFGNFAADDREVFQQHTQMQAIRGVRYELQVYARNHKKTPKWEKFATLISQGYQMLGIDDDEQEAALSEELSISSPLIMRDYMLGAARPSPERAAKICGTMADCLLVKEADVFAKAMRLCVNAKRASGAKPR